MLRRTLLFSAVLLLSLTMGCTTTQKWMAGGAAIGAATGGIWGAHAGGSLNAGEGAAVGAVAGATVGALVGDVISDKDWKAKEAELNRQIADLKAQLAAKDQQLADANKKIADLQAELDNLRKTARIPALEINLGTDVLFRPGSARLSEAGKKALEQAAQTINAQYKGKFIMVEGHTDSNPIRHSNWKSNWELGSARGLAVLHFLEKKGGVDPATLSAGTFSMYKPLASNDTKEGRAQNRRSVIVIYSSWPVVTPAVK